MPILFSRERVRASYAIGVMALLWAQSAGAQNDGKVAEAVDTCPMPYGTIAINEPNEQSRRWLDSYQLASPSTLLRTMAQQSNCFVVVERGIGMQNMRQERDLMSSGELQGGENVGKGQVVAADFMMVPTVQGSERTAVQGGGMLGKLRDKFKGALKFTEARTSITVSSTRTSIQVASGAGEAKTKLNGGGLFGKAGLYSDSPEGKVIAASLLDNFNTVVLSLKANPNIKPMSAARLAKLSGEPEAGGAFEKGAIVTPKINGAKFLTGSSSASSPLATLSAGESLLYLGERQDGFLRVQRGSVTGWVEQVLLVQSVKTFESTSSSSVSAETVMNEGDVKTSKIGGVKVVRTASDTAVVVTTLKRGEEVVLLGEEKGPFVRVQAAGGEGWVKKALLR
jgi:curli biogenesis system outer membrane secretion channel CsgG